MLAGTNVLGGDEQITYSMPSQTYVWECMRSPSRRNVIGRGTAAAMNNIPLIKVQPISRTAISFTRPVCGTYYASGGQGDAAGSVTVTAI